MNLIINISKNMVISVVYVIQMHGTYPVLKQLSRLEPSSFLLLFRNVGRMAVEYTKVSWIFFSRVA